MAVKTQKVQVYVIAFIFNKRCIKVFCQPFQLKHAVLYKYYIDMKWKSGLTQL